MFFKQKTAYEIRISDWSSDVCSSDLPLRLRFLARQGPRADCRSLASRGIGADGTAASLRYETSIARTELLRDIRAGQCVAGRSQARSDRARRSEEHTSELQSLMRNSYAVFCLKKKKQIMNKQH